mmetsp:Transcript_41405/g.99747  ORF Transcript_41405/g.99747 Transcript_41405/m.99747 type:complete len:92 (-) Transcript_41405:20-295(-)
MGLKIVREISHQDGWSTDVENHLRLESRAPSSRRRSSYKHKGTLQSSAKSYNNHYVSGKITWQKKQSSEPEKRVNSQILSVFSQSRNTFAN